MPPAKRARANPKPSAKPATGTKATRAAASGGAKATATSAAKAAGRTATQAKSAATKTGRATASTTRTARSGAKATGTAAKRGAKSTRATARSASTRVQKASGGDGITSVAEQLVKGAVKPADLVMLTRERIRETLDDAAARGRVTRKDADELVIELVRRGRSHSDDFRSEIEGLLGRVETTAKRAGRAKPVDRLVRGADRARRAAGVGPSFPILEYDSLNAGQVQSRVKDLSRPELRKVLTYERKHANRKTVVGPIEKALS